MKKITNKEFSELSDTEKIKYIKSRISNNQIITALQFGYLSNEIRNFCAVESAYRGWYDYISNKHYFLLSSDGKRDYAVATALVRRSINDIKFFELSKEAKRDYAVAKASTGYHIANWEYQYHLNEEFKKEYVNVLKIQKLISVSKNKTALEKFQNLIRDKYKLTNRLDFITDEQFKLFSQVERIEYSIAMLMQGKEISASKFYLLSPNNKKEYLSNKKNKL